MFAVRSRLLGFPALWLVAAALALGLRALVPNGMMVEQSGQLAITVSICRDASIGPAAITLEIPRKSPAPDKPADEQTKCAFGALGQTATLPPIDVLLAAVAFVMALALLPAAQIDFPRIVRLRPPLRGPPTPS